jgi:hypothetical protein
LRVVGYIAAALAIALALLLISFACGWINAGREIVSPKNVKAQYGLAYDDYEAMGALARQACRVDAVIQEEKDPAVRSQRLTQRVAIENRYDTVAAEYEARIEDLFRAKVVRPRDLPAEAPTLEERQAEVCPR